MRIQLHQEVICYRCKWLVPASVLCSSSALLTSVVLVFVAGLMLLFPLGCAIIGFLSWQKLRPYAAKEEKRGKFLHSGLVNSALLKSIISVLCISQLAKFVKWAENKIPRGANPDSGDRSETDSVKALECDKDYHEDILFWYNPLASIFADQACKNLDGGSTSSCSSADDDEEEQEAQEFTEIENWACEADLSRNLEARSNLRICEAAAHMFDTAVRGHAGFRDQAVRESEVEVDGSANVLWCDIPWTERGIAAVASDSKLSDTTSPKYKHQRRSCAIRDPNAVRNEPKSAYTFGSQDVDVSFQNPSTGEGNTGVRFHGLEEETRGREEHDAFGKAESMDRDEVGYSDARHYYSRKGSKRKHKGKACVMVEAGGQAASDDEVNKALPYMWELETVWRRVSEGNVRGRQPADGHHHREHGQFSELLDFWHHVEQVSSQHTYTPPTSAPVSPSNSSSSCTSPH